MQRIARVASLPHPCLEQVAAGQVRFLTDPAAASHAGVRFCFAERFGGASLPPYDSLNISVSVGDSLEAVRRNRRILLDALLSGSGRQADEYRIVNPSQVHGTRMVSFSADEPQHVAAMHRAALKGADALCAIDPGVALLLGFADCVPVILVSPSGRFAVVHAGWRGALAGIVGKSAAGMAAQDARDFGGPASWWLAEQNMYIGAYIHPCCFETGDDVRSRFVERYGSDCLAGNGNVHLGAVVQEDFIRAGGDAARIAHAGICTACGGWFYSYRASGGTCGRHAALALRTERTS